MRIDDYLRELERHLGVGPLARRRILREIEAHLDDSVRQEQKAGVDREEAERRAIARLGPVDAFALGFSTGSRRGHFVAAGIAIASLAGAVAATLVLVLTPSGPHRPKLIVLDRSAPYSRPQKVPGPTQLGTPRPIASTQTLKPLGGASLVTARDFANHHVYLGVESRHGREVSRDYSPLPIGVVHVTPQREWGGGYAGFEGGRWQMSLSPSRTTALSLFEVAAGRAPRQASWIALLGLARTGVAKVVGTWPNGTMMRFHLNHRSAFAYALSIERDFPTAVSAFDEDGMLLDRIELPQLQQACSLTGCGSPPDGGDDITFTASRSSGLPSQP